MIPLETLYTQTALGIRFFDAAARIPVTDGLLVTAQLLSADRTRRVGKKIGARRATSGAYAFFGLYPKAERPASDAEIFWDNATPIPTKRVVIDVRDGLGRFLPTSFDLDIPVQRAFRGFGAGVTRPLMLPTPASADDCPGVHLYSAAARSIPAGMTAIYGRIVVGNADADEAPPAKFAVVRVIDPATSKDHAIGITDEKGRLTLPLAYPPIPENMDFSSTPLKNQTYALNVRIFYDPDDVNVRLPGSAAPNLARVLGQTTQCSIASVRHPDTHNLTSAAQHPITLKFETPLVLRTTIEGTSASESVLHITRP